MEVDANFNGVRINNLQLMYVSMMVTSEGFDRFLFVLRFCLVRLKVTLVLDYY